MSLHLFDKKQHGVMSGWEVIVEVLVPLTGTGKRTGRTRAYCVPDTRVSLC